MSSGSSTQPRIAIIGGGLGGLALLLTLHRRGVPATLYERDPSVDARAHLGGSLDLGWKSGQRALRENGLQDLFDQNSRPEGEEMTVRDAAGAIHLQLGAVAPGAPPRPKEDVRPEIDRTVLRKLLLDAVPPDLIRWDHAPPRMVGFSDLEADVGGVCFYTEPCANSIPRRRTPIVVVRPVASLPCQPFVKIFNNLSFFLRHRHRGSARRGLAPCLLAHLPVSALGPTNERAMGPTQRLVFDAPVNRDPHGLHVFPETQRVPDELDVLGGRRQRPVVLLQDEDVVARGEEEPVLLHRQEVRLKAGQARDGVVDLLRDGGDHGHHRAVEKAPGRAVETLQVRFSSSLACAHRRRNSSSRTKPNAVFSRLSAYAGAA